MKASEINPSEYLPYYQKYISLVGNTPLNEALENGKKNALRFYRDIPEPKLLFRYAEDKWTPLDILLHVIDTERVFAYRALSFARSSNADLAGFDENVFAENAGATQRTMSSLLDEYSAVRDSTRFLFNTMNEASLQKTGKANNNFLSARAAGFIICGHEIHHCNIIRERYL